VAHIHCTVDQRITDQVRLVAAATRADNLWRGADGGGMHGHIERLRAR
jgi:hypothetical protein